MSECTHDCSSCSENCSERSASLLEKTHELTHIKKVIAVVSGKGGVGKSLVTSLMTVLTNRQGFKTAILDADITGPSIPKVFGVSGGIEANELGMYPKESKFGTKIMSSNLLLPHEDDPVIWRGPIIAGMVKQFWTDVIWDDVDFMYVDMPPGTGDVPLTVFQSIKVDGIIVVTSPQELVSMIVGKAVKMAYMMNIPVLGVVENMSYVKCDSCGHEIKLFGESKLEEVAKNYGLKILGRIPFDAKLATLCDHGLIELVEDGYLDDAVTLVTKE